MKAPLVCIVISQPNVFIYAHTRHTYMSDTGLSVMGQYQLKAILAFLTPILSVWNSAPKLDSVPGSVDIMCQALSLRSFHLDYTS